MAPRETPLGCWSAPLVAATTRNPLSRFALTVPFSAEPIWCTLSAQHTPCPRPRSTRAWFLVEKPPRNLRPQHCTRHSLLQALRTAIRHQWRTTCSLPHTFYAHRYSLMGSSTTRQCTRRLSPRRTRTQCGQRSSEIGRYSDILGKSSSGASDWILVRWPLLETVRKEHRLRQHHQSTHRLLRNQGQCHILGRNCR